jgi:RNA polymerase sigma-70 factor (ECF subfamily)
MNANKDLAADLFTAAAGGNRAAYAQILTWLAMRLRWYFGRLVFSSGPLEVEKLVQDTLLAVHAKWHTYDPSRPYLSWLQAVARHKLTDALRRLHHSVHIPLDDVQDWLAAPELQQENTASLLKDLPADQRRAIELVKLNDNSLAHTAHVMNRSEGAIKQLLHRGIGALRRKVSS